MLSVTNDFKTALTQPRQIDAKVVVNNSTTLDGTQLNSIQREFNTDLFKTIVKKVEIDSNVSMNKGDTIVPSMGLLVNDAFEYLSLGTFKVKDAPELNKDTNSYQISTYDKIVECMVSYDLTSSDITYPCTVRQLFVAIFTKLGWVTSGIPSTFVNSTSQIEEDVYSNMNMTYRDVLDELCTISCMFLADKNGVPTLYQKTITSETINEEFMKDANVVVKNRVFFNSLVFSRASESDNIYRKDDTSIANNGLHEFKVSNLQILSLNWRDNFIDAMWNYIKTFEYYAFEIDTIGIGYLEPVDAFTLSTFSDTYNTLLLNDDLTIRDGISERIYADEPKENETDYRYASDTDKKINQTNLIVDKQNGVISAVVSRVDTIQNEIDNPTATLSGTSFDIEDALDQPLQDFKMYGDTYQDETPTPSSPQPIHNVSGDNTIEICGKNLFDIGTDLSSYFQTYQDGIKINNNSVNRTTATISNNKLTINTYDNTGWTWLAKWVKLNKNTDYIISGTNTHAIRVVGFNSKEINTIGTLIKVKGPNTQDFSFNSGEYDYYCISFFPSGANNYFENLQIEKGTTSTEYEPYTGQSQLISLGVENLLPNNATSQTINGITFTKNEDGTITANGTASATTTLYMGNADCLKGGSGTYTISSGLDSASNVRFGLSINGTYYNTNDSRTLTFETITGNGNSYCQIDSGKTVNNLVFYPMIEKGSKKNSYSPYRKEPIELCKIGTYQDYIYKTDKWYLHKETIKKVLDGSYSWNYYSNGHYFYNQNFLNDYPRSGDGQRHSIVYITDYFKYIEQLAPSQDNEMALVQQPDRANEVNIRMDNLNGVTTDLKTWLSNNNVYIYMPLATPTDTEITDTTLLEQLDNLMTIPLIKDLTHIIITPNDLTPTLDIEYLRNTSINENFVRQPQLESYYTKVETDAQIEISSNQIQSTVSELQTQVDSNGNAISSVSNQVQNLQTSTSTQINTINQTLENGVSKLTNSLVTIDINGINTSKADETFNTQITNKTFEVRDGTSPLVFVGYKVDEQRTVAQIPELEARQITAGVHRTEIIEEDNELWTADYYIGDGS